MMWRKSFVVPMVLAFGVMLLMTPTQAMCEGELEGTWSVMMGVTDASGYDCWKECNLTIGPDIPAVVSDQPMDQNANGVPGELPYPYLYRVEFELTRTNLEIPVYHQDPRIFPGLWRHPSGVHVYFEPEKSRKFMELVKKV